MHRRHNKSGKRFALMRPGKNERQRRNAAERGEKMGVLMGIAALLLVLWIAGLALHLFGGFIHILIIAAAVLFVISMFTGRSTTV